MQSEEGPSLTKERGLRRIDVLGGVLGGRKNPPAEGDDLAVVVADGKDEPLAKAVAQGTVASSGEKPAGAEFLVSISGLASVAEEGFPAVQGVAQLPRAGGVSIDLTGFEVVSRSSARGGPEQVLLKVGGGEAVEVEQLVPKVAALIVTRGRLFLDQGDPGPLGQSADRGGEVDPLVFHDKFEDAPAGPAAEAVVGLLLGADVKGRGLLAVEGAGGAPTGPGALEGEVAADDFNDVAGGGDPFDAFLGNAWHAAECRR